MPIQFKPKSEDELSRFGNLPDGDYPFTVLESSEVASKSAKNAGKMMIKLKLNVHGPEFDKHVYDYFADWFSEWKLKHFHEVAGLSKQYDSGQVDASNNAYQGRTGFVRIKVEDDPTWGEKNTVDDYILQKTVPRPTEPAKPAANEDDVPF